MLMLWNTLIGIISFVLLLVFVLAFPKTAFAFFVVIFFVGCAAAIIESFWKSAIGGPPGSSEK